MLLLFVIYLRPGKPLNVTIKTDLRQINNDDFVEAVLKGDHACKLENCIAVIFCVVVVYHLFEAGETLECDNQNNSY